MNKRWNFIDASLNDSEFSSSGVSDALVATKLLILQQTKSVTSSSFSNILRSKLFSNHSQSFKISDSVNAQAISKDIK